MHRALERARVSVPGVTDRKKKPGEWQPESDIGTGISLAQVCKEQMLLGAR